MRKLVAMITMSTVAALGAALATADAAIAVTPSAAVSSPNVVVQLDDMRSAATHLTTTPDAADRGSAVSLADLFEMAMLMNHFSQIAEMSTNVVNASHTSVSAMARGIKA